MMTNGTTEPPAQYPVTSPGLGGTVLFLTPPPKKLSCLLQVPNKDI